MNEIVIAALVMFLISFDHKTFLRQMSMSYGWRERYKQDKNCASLLRMCKR